jgi:transposase IS66 family protein
MCARNHLPLHRQEKIFERHGVDISRKTMAVWMAQCAHLLDPLYGSLKGVLFQSKVIGTDDTSVKLLDANLLFARTGRIWLRSLLYLRLPTRGPATARVGSGDGLTLPGNTLNEAVGLQREHHLVDQRWRDSKIAPHVRLGRRPSVHFGVVVDESQVLPLLFGEACLRGAERL